MPFKSLCSDASGNYFNYQNSRVEDLLVQGIQEKMKQKKSAQRTSIYFGRRSTSGLFANHLPLMAANKKFKI